METASDGSRITWIALWTICSAGRTIRKSTNRLIILFLANMRTAGLKSVITEGLEPRTQKA